MRLVVLRLIVLRLVIIFAEALLRLRLLIRRARASAAPHGALLFELLGHGVPSADGFFRGRLLYIRVLVRSRIPSARAFALAGEIVVAVILELRLPPARALAFAGEVVVTELLQLVPERRSRTERSHRAQSVRGARPSPRAHFAERAVVQRAVHAERQRSQRIPLRAQIRIHAVRQSADPERARSVVHRSRAQRRIQRRTHGRTHCRTQRSVQRRSQPAHRGEPRARGLLHSHALRGNARLGRILRICGRIRIGRVRVRSGRPARVIRVVCIVRGAAVCVVFRTRNGFAHCRKLFL